MKYDYLIVGSGLTGACFARLLKDKGNTVLVVDKRNHVAGNIYTEQVEGINVHKYGAHIFHTNNKDVWDFVNKYATFNNYRHKVKANYKGEIYDLPFNMNTFKQLWNVDDKDDVKRIIANQTKDIDNPRNLEDYCIATLGKDLFEKLIKGYSEKQWGKDCAALPISLIKRLPIRYEFNNDYFDDKYQGIPVGGYTELITNLLSGIEVKLNYDFKYKQNDIDYQNLIYTGSIDSFFDYSLGRLEYRSLDFVEEIIYKEYYQDNSVINFTDIDVPYIRIIEHKYFENYKTDKTVITKEYPKQSLNIDEAYYPIDDKKNNDLYKQYRKLAKNILNVLFVGRLANYKYYNMDEVVKLALDYSNFKNANNNTNF